MDVLIPFSSVYLSSGGDFGKAVEAARKAAEGTRELSAKLGRATYVGGLEGKVLPPDPGAYVSCQLLIVSRERGRELTLYDVAGSVRNLDGSQRRIICGRCLMGS